MNFSGTTPKEIYKWIDDKNKGNDTEYIKCKQDTQEAIDVFLSLYGIQFRTAYQLFIHLKKHLCMTLNKSQSLYRAFIVLTNDEIITLRLSQHFAKRNSTEKAFGKHRKPTLAYHLVIGRIEQDVNPKTDIYYDKIFKGVEIKVREYDLNEFNGNRKAIVDEIVYLLTNGTQPPKITDNKHYMNMNKQVIRLTEGDLHKIVRESVRKILKENSMYKNGILSQKGVTAVNNSNAQTEHERFLKKYTPNFTKRKKLKEYTGDFGYSDDPNYNKFAQQNRPQQKQTPPLANYQPKRLGGNLVSNDGGESYMWDDSQQRQFGNNGTVEESAVNEVMYNGYSYHGNDKTSWDMVGAQREANKTLRLGDLFNAVEGGDINKAQTVLKQLKHNIKQSRKDDVNSRSL